jgi:hypothetical protein
MWIKIETKDSTLGFWFRVERIGKDITGVEITFKPENANQAVYFKENAKKITGVSFNDNYVKMSLGQWLDYFQIVVSDEIFVKYYSGVLKLINSTK